jgi:hypothetical protein
VDEADQLLDMGFRPDIERILNFLPTNRQTLLFSATIPDTLKKVIGQVGAITSQSHLLSIITLQLLFALQLLPNTHSVFIPSFYLLRR